MSYRIKEVFLSLQGEGIRAGTKAVFIRFAGCNLWNGKEQDRGRGRGACARWCDTNFVGGEEYTIESLLSTMEDLWSGGRKWCVLTGGEPLLQVDLSLVAALSDAGWCTALETNGTISLPCAFDWVTVSPKRSDLPIVVRPDELKVVLGGDGGWTEDEVVAMVHPVTSKVLCIQPVSIDGCTNAAECVAFVMRHAEWRLSIQLHKVLGLR